MTESRAGLRLKVLAALVVAMFAALTTRLWFLQVLAADDLARIANANAVRLVEWPAERGTIKDASGEVLVGNRPSSVVTAGFRIPGVGPSLYPPNILIGTVSRVLSDEGALEKSIRVRPAVDFSSLHVVLVVLSSGTG